MANEGKGLRRSLISVISLISLYIVLHSLIFVMLPSLFPQLEEALGNYSIYISVSLTLAIGYMAAKSLAEFAYWSARLRYDEGTSATIRSLVRIVGIASLLSAVAGGVAGGAAGVALGGFLGIVIGQGSQHVIGQAVAGFIVLVSRPISIGEKVTIANETGIVKEITTMFTVIEKEDGSIALIPNNMLMGSKIYKHVVEK